MSIYEQGLNPAPVNHIALSPLSFIERTAAVYPHYPAVVHGAVRSTGPRPMRAAAAWPRPWPAAASRKATRWR